MNEGQLCLKNTGEDRLSVNIARDIENIKGFYRPKRFINGVAKVSRSFLAEKSD